MKAGCFRIGVQFAIAWVALAFIWGNPAAALESSELMPLVSKSLLLDVAMLKSGRIVAVGERGHIIYSDDQGESWHQAMVPTRATLTAVFFQDENTGWAAGHDAVILMTHDGAATWETVFAAPDVEKPILDLWLADGKNGYAVGAYGLFLETDNGGNSWRQRPIMAEDPHLNQIKAAENKTLYLAAEAGTVLRSTDNGASWQALDSPYEGSFFGILPLKNDSILLFGLRGNIFRSDTSGDAWQKIETGTQAMLNDGLRLSDGRIVIVGLEGALLVSSDDGMSFTLFSQAGRKGISSAVLTRDNHLLLIGEGGVRKISTDFSKPASSF